MFKVYFEIGLKHIADLAAYDHILFIVALCAVYKLSEWKKILILVTAFTIGHSITLAMSALNMITINSSLIEFLIPVTIFLTALYNIVFIRESKIIRVHSLSKAVSVKYFIALFFGLIHGMGFSNYFKALLGQEANITFPLFAFNVGIEIGQLLIVAVMLVISILMMTVFKLPQKIWNWTVSGIALLMSIRMMVNTWAW
ncbi:MAG: HupE/UreJ family protein [Bacteroidetes bacterium]|nr:HupE/UreJ family protein [Bacteroidota bacterium]